MTVRDLYLTVSDFDAFTQVRAYDKTGAAIKEVKCWDDIVSNYGEKEVLQYSFETLTITLGVYHARIN